MVDEHETGENARPYYPLNTVVILECTNGTEVGDVRFKINRGRWVDAFYNPYSRRFEPKTSTTWTSPGGFYVDTPMTCRLPGCQDPALTFGAENTPIPRGIALDRE